MNIYVFAASVWAAARPVHLVFVACSRWARSTFVLRAARLLILSLSVCGGYGLCATHVICVVLRVITSTTGFVLCLRRGILVHEHADLTVVSSLLSMAGSWIWVVSY